MKYLIKYLLEKYLKIIFHPEGRRLERIINCIFERPIFGFGSQADRYLINQTASNGLLYAINSSGIVGFIFFLLFQLLYF